ncbi:enoyl-CoA hydratase/isomerase family protein [Daejeonella sp.]|uniref:enoyl-CoA hydratase/isomerase family protein n=1 Tax=Daejeonella sp. TaxID=2805397 RepID=UPI0027B8C944|nr:enoyl-CoA hydratase/isomerase family protein [Daejeonella sp.]
MNTIKVNIKDKIAVLSMNRGKSNAINAEMVTELHQMVRNIENDDSIAGLILTGKDGFFSAGLDLIELYNYDEETIKKFWIDFLDLITTLVSFKKPMIAAISGHSPAGGCVLALCCDYRIMAEGKFIIGLNEVPIGIIIPESIFHLYSFWLGQANAYRFLLEGKLMHTQQALSTGLIDEVVNPESILHAAERKMLTYIKLERNAWQQSKKNMRAELLKKVSADPTEMISPMLAQWWSASTRSILKTIIQNLQQKPD